MSVSQGVAILMVGVHHAYQRMRSEHPSDLEVKQRNRFSERISELIHQFKPTIVADESEYTDNEDLLSQYPKDARAVCIDIPTNKRTQKGLWVYSSMKHLCPYVDGIRERFWRWRLFEEIKQEKNARVLLFCGSLHLHSLVEKPLSFPDILHQAGYAVSAIDLRSEAWWDESWTKSWVDPNPQPPIKSGGPCCIDLGMYDGSCRLK